MEVTPRAPFDRWPVDLHIEGIGFAWYLREVGAFVTQTYTEHGSLAGADQVNDCLDHVLSREQRDIQAFGGVLVLYDWRSIRTFDAAAGTRFMQRLAQRKPGYLRRSLVVFAAHNRLLETAVRATSAFAALAIGRRVELTTSIDDALGETSIALTQPRASFGSLRRVARR